MMARRIRSRRSSGSRSPTSSPFKDERVSRRASRAAVRSPASRDDQASGAMPVAASLTRAAMPGGGEVVWEGLDRLERLGPRRRGRAGLARATAMSARRGSSSAASRRDSSSPLASSSSALRRREAVEEGLDLGGRDGADELVDHLTVAERLHRRDPLHAVAAPRAPGWSRRRPWRGRPRRRAWPRPLPAPGSAVCTGPHQSAQKSTTTGTSLERSMTSRSKSTSFASIGIRKFYGAATVGPCVRSKVG